MLGSVAASMAVPAVEAAPVQAKAPEVSEHLWLAAGEGGGGGEGEGKRIDPATAELRDLGLAEGHLRSAQALRAIGDAQAADTQAGLAAGITLPEGMMTAAGSTDGTVMAFAEYRAAQLAKTRIDALIVLTRMAADFYTAAVAAGTATNLDSYHAAWGMMQAIKSEVAALSGSDAADVVAVAEKFSGYIIGAETAFGDVTGLGGAETDPGLIYGAAARMELAAARLK